MPVPRLTMLPVPLIAPLKVSVERFESVSVAEPSDTEPAPLKPSTVSLMLLKFIVAPLETTTRDPSAMRPEPESCKVPWPTTVSPV